MRPSVARRVVWPLVSRCGGRKVVGAEYSSRAVTWGIPSGTELQKPFELGVLIAVGGVDVDVQPGFPLLRLIPATEDDRRLRTTEPFATTTRPSSLCAGSLWKVTIFQPSRRPPCGPRSGWRLYVRCSRLLRARCPASRSRDDARSLASACPTRACPSPPPVTPPVALHHRICTASAVSRAVIEPGSRSRAVSVRRVTSARGRGWRGRG